MRDLVQQKHLLPSDLPFQQEWLADLPKDMRSLELAALNSLKSGLLSDIKVRMYKYQSKCQQLAKQFDVLEVNADGKEEQKVYQK